MPQPPTLQMGQNQWFGLDHHTFTLTELPGQPDGWREGARIQEKPVETVLLHHFTQLAGLETQAVAYGRSGDAWGAMDIELLDDLGRVHMAELKTSAFGTKDANQLRQYLLTRVLRDPDSVIRERWKRLVDHECQPERLASYIAGVAGGLDDGTLTFDRIRRYGGFSGTQYHWNKKLVEDGDGQRRSWRVRALLARATHKLGLNVPSQDDLVALAHRLFSDHWASGHALVPRVASARPAFVLWMIAPSLTGAEKNLHEWRSMGIDARYLELEARSVRSEGGLVLRVRREDRSGADGAERHASQWLRQQPRLPDGKRYGVRASLYESGRPSKPRERDGSLRAQPTISVYLPNGRSEKFGPLGQVDD